MKFVFYPGLSPDSLLCFQGSSGDTSGADKSHRYAFLPTKLKPQLRTLLSQPILDAGGNATAARVIWRNKGDLAWHSLPAFQNQLDELIKNIPDVGMFFSCVTTVFQRGSYLSVIPSVAYWVARDTSGDAGIVLRTLREQLSNVEIKQVQAGNTSDHNEEAYKCLTVVLKDHNTPWLLRKLTESGGAFTELAWKPIARAYVLNRRYLGIIRSAEGRLREEGMNLYVEDLTGGKD